MSWLVTFGLLVALAYSLIGSPTDTRTGEVSIGGDEWSRDSGGADGAGDADRVAGGSAEADRLADGGAPGRGERRAVVLRVADGDTVLVRILAAGGRPTRRTERVRYIGVDTPESVKPNAPVECFGKRASEFNRRLVDGRRVRLVPDREPLDRYGRTLAYVYVGETFVNAELVRRGYARTLTIPPNTAKARYLAHLERVAKRTKAGLWGACGR